MKKIYLIILLLNIASCTTKQAIIKSNQKQIAKDFFICKCLQYGLGEEINNEIVKIDMSMGMLFEIGDVGMYYKKIDSFAKIEITNLKPFQLSDYGDKKPIISKCLELSRSEKLNSILKE